MAGAAIDALLIEIRAKRDQIDQWQNEAAMIDVRIDEAEEYIAQMERAIETLRAKAVECIPSTT